MALSWSTFAGYDPGQSQYITVYYTSRSAHTIVIDVSFSMYSDGQDDFYYSERHNKAIITASYANTSGGTSSVSSAVEYQLPGWKASGSYSTRLTLYNVANNETSISMYYENQRIWVNAPSAAWSPRSTGVCGYTYIGELPVNEAAKYTVTFNQDNEVAKTSLPQTITNYGGEVVKSPSSIVDSNNFYVCKGFNTTPKEASSEANFGTPTLGFDASITLSKNINYYACWERQKYKYYFYGYKNNNNTLYPEDKFKNPTVHTYDIETTLPNLEEYNKNTPNNIYYREGYTFKNWYYNLGGNKVNIINNKCNVSTDLNLYPVWEAKTFGLKFDFGYDNKIVNKQYTYDSNFDFNTLLNGKSNTLFRPGYKLMGWTSDKKLASKIYNPFEVNQSLYNYAYNDNKKIVFPKNVYNDEVDTKGLTLYAVWEYYTTCYVFVDGVWRLALPHIYKDGKWNISLANTYTESKWKL